MSKKHFKLISTLCCLAVFISLAACDSTNQVSKSTSEPDSGEGRVKVSVTFNAITEFVQAVGRDKVKVSTIIPDGTEPHDFEPKAQDLVALSNADIFIYNGLGMESWVDGAVKAANNPNLIVVDASDGITPIANIGKEIDEHGQYDPHIWLSIKGAQAEVTNIKNALVTVDSANKDFYEQNCNEFITELDNLYNEYNQKFSSCPKKNFITGHAAFAYLCRDFGLEQNSVEDVFAEGEPGPKQLAALTEYCKKNQVTTIFAEEMASPEVSQTLASEVGAKVETIYTMEGSEDHKSYLERMESNLSKIAESLAK